MTKIMIREHNIETGEIIDREASAEELAQMKIDGDAIKTETEAIAIQEAQKAAILERLGLTAEEAAILLK